MALMNLVNLVNAMSAFGLKVEDRTARLAGNQVVAMPPTYLPEPWFTEPTPTPKAVRTPPSGSCGSGCRVIRSGSGIPCLGLKELLQKQLQQQSSESQQGYPRTDYRSAERRISEHEDRDSIKHADTRTTIGAIIGTIVRGMRCIPGGN